MQPIGNQSINLLECVHVFGVPSKGKGIPGETEARRVPQTAGKHDANTLNPKP